MAKRVYFCFHYQDVIDFRVDVVRNHWMTEKDRGDAGFFDASIWEEARKKGKAAIKQLINSELENTSSTCALIGKYTYARPWVRYEILRSIKRGNFVFAVHINGIKGKDQKTRTKGNNPFDYLGIRYSDDGKSVKMYELKNGEWIEYLEIGGSSSYSYILDETLQSNKGKFYQLSKFCPTYDWLGDDGCNNFAKWVK